MHNTHVLSRNAAYIPVSYTHLDVYKRQDVLTVFAPITSNYKVKGYVVIHTDMNDIQKSCNSLLNISDVYKRQILRYDHTG